MRNALFCCGPSAAVDAVASEVVAPPVKTWKLTLDREGPAGWLRDITADQRAQLFRFVSSFKSLSEEPIRISASGVSTLTGIKATNPLVNYSMGSTLGAGSFATVREYTHKSDQVYAIKSLPLREATTFREIQAAIALSGYHNVVNIKKILVSKDAAHLVMERLQNHRVTDAQYRAAVNCGHHIFDVPAIQLGDRAKRNMAIRDDSGESVVQLDLGLLDDYDVDRTAQRLEDFAAGRTVDIYRGVALAGRHEDDSDQDRHFYDDY